MRVLFFCHFWAPYHFAGSEMMAQNVLRSLRDSGHETLVIATHEFTAPDEWIFEGTRCLNTHTNSGYKMIQDYAPDVIITHHQETPYATAFGNHLNIPVVQMAHNTFDDTEDWLRLKPAMVIWNTEYVRDEFAKYNLPGTVLHPPVYAEDHSTERGNKVTFVNLNYYKGAQVFYDLVERMPDVEFMGVEGGYGAQVFEQWDNVTLQKQTTDMKNDVWANTKILLVPSTYESYGMVGVEAMASGIPILASPTPGLKESLSYAGTFINREDTDAWETHIRRLLNDTATYDNASALSLQRSRELDPEKELQNVTLELERLVGTWPTQHRKTLQPVLVVS